MYCNSLSNFAVSAASRNATLLSLDLHTKVSSSTNYRAASAEFSYERTASGAARRVGGINSVVSLPRPSRVKKMNVLLSQDSEAGWLPRPARRFETAPCRRQIAKLLSSNVALRSDSPEVLWSAVARCSPWSSYFFRPPVEQRRYTRWIAMRETRISLLRDYVGNFHTGNAEYMYTKGDVG